jgi:hypothetical protein
MKGFLKIEELADDNDILAEMYCDCILISLREIKNWIQISENFTRKLECLKYWKNVLEESISNLTLLW